MKRHLARILVICVVCLAVFSAVMAADTAEFNGQTYEKIYTVVCDSSLTLIDPQFDRYFAEGSAEAGVRAISKTGNVFVNGQQIPYTLEDGTVSSEALVVNGENAIWQVEGGWAWKVHLQRQWDDGFFMPRVEENYVQGAPVDLETAAYLYTKHIAYMIGQTVEFYALPGESTASLISTTYLTSTMVGELVKEGDTVTVLGTDGSEKGVFAAENFDDSIQPEDLMIYWEDGVRGWTAKRAYAQVGRLIENTDPNNDNAIKEPFFLENGASETITTGDSYIGKSFGEAFRHTQFIRGERRTDQYKNEDEVIIMWSSDELPDHVIGFTRGEGAYKALVHAIAYAEEVTKDVVVSADGTDVEAGKYWVPEDIWTPFAEKLAEANAMAEAAASSNVEYDEMLFALGNVLGGTEDLNSKGPMKMNPLGVIGTMQPGTK
ncbi:MAG: hypothetical protein IKP86_02285 [Anaerolineaceae bacterium]|nr:hypothetical protein [Anaerolineaceae bacterium]